MILHGKSFTDCGYIIEAGYNYNDIQIVMDYAKNDPEADLIYIGILDNDFSDISIALTIEKAEELANHILKLTGALKNTLL